MEVRQLQIFRVLAGELNFARTAEKVPHGAVEYHGT